MKHLEIWRRLTSLLVKKCWELSFFVLALIPGVLYIGDSYWDSLQLKLTPLLGKEEPGFGNDLEPLVLEIKHIRHISSSRGYIICPLKQGDQLQASPEAVSADNFQLMPGHHQRCYQATTKTYRVPYSHLALGVTVTCIYTSTLPLVNLLVLILSVWIWALPNLPPLSCGVSKYPEKRWERKSPDRQMLVLIHFIFTVEWQHIQCWSLHCVTCFPCGEMYSPIQAPNLLYILSGASYRTRAQPALCDHKS